MNSAEEIATEICQLKVESALDEAKSWGVDARVALALVEKLAKVNTTEPGAVAALKQEAQAFYVANGGEV